MEPSSIEELIDSHKKISLLMFHSAWQDLWQMLLATILWISQLLVLSRTSVIFAHAFFCKTVSGVWYLSATSYDTVMLSELSCYHWCPHRRLDFGWHSTMSRLSPRRANQTIMALLSLIRLRGHFSYLVCPMVIGFLLGKYAYQRSARDWDLCPGPGRGLKSLPGSRPGSRVTFNF